MSEGSEQAELDSRDDETLVFRKVGEAKLRSAGEYEEQGNQVLLAASSECGVACIQNAAGALSPYQIGSLHFHMHVWNPSFAFGSDHMLCGR